MRSWLLRGLIFAFGMVVLRLIQGALINQWETSATMISVCLVLIYGAVVLVWGFVDGRADANAEPEPERRADLAMTWLLAGLVAGVLAGAVTWLISKFYKGVYALGLMGELTLYAAFTALLVFMMATIGVAVGRALVDRRYNREHPVPRHTGDTDVFAAVNDDKTQDSRAR